MYIYEHFFSNVQKQHIFESFASLKNFINRWESDRLIKVEASQCRSHRTDSIKKEEKQNQ